MNHRVRRNLLSVRQCCAAIVCVSSVSTKVSAASLTGLGRLAGYPYSGAYGVSGDGKVVVGINSGHEAFRWEGGNMTGFENLQEGWFSSARAVSADGTVVVGNDENSGEAAIWKDGRITLLGTLPGGWFGMANGVSANGEVVVGISNFAGGQQQQGFRWEAGRMTGIGGRSALGVSADGTVIVGYAEANDPSFRNVPFRWKGGTMTFATEIQGDAFGVSPDGRVVVGYRQVDFLDIEAFRWEGDKLTGLGDLPGGSLYSIAKAASSMGKVVVGFGTSEYGSEAVLWTQEYGIETIWSVLARAGANPAFDGWWELTEAPAVSADGRYVVGTGIHHGEYEAFLADLKIEPPPCPTNGVVLPGSVSVVVPGQAAGLNQYAMIANPLKAISNKVSDVIKLNTTDSLVLYHFGKTGFTTSVASEGRWIEGGDVEIAPGGGFFASSSTKNPVNIIFTGDADLSGAAIGNVIPTGLSIRSSPLPKTGTLGELEYPVTRDLAESDTIYQWDGSQYIESASSSGVWLSPTAVGPTVRAGEAFWVRRTGTAGLWKQRCP